MDNLLKELSYRDTTELIKDSLFTEILCKISDYVDEVEHFEKKYGKTFTEFKEEYEAGEEDFEKYDDMMEWEFAKEGKEYWQAKLKEAENVL